MSGSGHFCPRCGNPLEPGEGIPAPDLRGNTRAELCIDCYLAGIDLVSVPDHVTVRVCPRCGSARSNDEWEDAEGTDFTDIAIDAVASELQVHRDAREVSWAVEPKHRGPNEIDLRLTVSAWIEGEPIEAERSVSVHIPRETCSRCGKMAGDYYAGTVQVRATGREPTQEEMDQAVEMAHSIIDATDDRDAFVSEVIERPEGVDIRVSSNKLGQQIAHRIRAEFGGTVDSSETLVTEDEEGEGVYRVAFAIRLPRFRPGDVITLDGGDPILVEGDVRARRLATGEAVTVDQERQRAGTRVGGIEDVSETTLVTVEDEHAIQVLDPDTAAAVSIPRPRDLNTDRHSVHVIKTECGLHAIPAAVVEEVQS